MTELLEVLDLDDMLSTGITYRQLDYWCRNGWLRPDVAHPGHGHSRRFDPIERKVAMSMLQLIGAGVEPRVAARIARDAVEVGLPYGLLTDTVAVMWLESTPEPTTGDAV